VAAGDVSPPDLRVEWDLKPSGASFRDVERESPATVRISRRGRILKSLPGQRPGASVPLDPGSYEIEISSEWRPEARARKAVTIQPDE